MASMPLALSVHNFISSVGADAGFAAIIGLAILVLLYFAHARETANLREQAALLTQRLQQAESRVAQLSQAQPAVAAQPGQVAQAATGPARAYPTAIPAAPAGVAAPALLAATRVVPLVVQPVPEPAAAPGPVPAPALAPVGAPAQTVSEPAEAATAAPPPVPAPMQAPAPAAAPATTAIPPQPGPTKAADALPPPDGPPTPAPAPAALTAAGANGAGHDRVAAPVGTVAGASTEPAGAQPRVASEPAASHRTLPPLSPPPRRRSGLGRRVALLVGALLIAGAIAALVVATADSGNSPTSSVGARTTNAPTLGRARSAVKFNPASVTVAVLNGTATNQLAHKVAARLTGVGYKQGTVATAANQTETTTIVSYLPGTTNRSDALHVAIALKLRRASVQPIDRSTQQVACPPPGACHVNVVVTVGANLANS